jgi:hypothetical protein
VDDESLSLLTLDYLVAALRIAEGVLALADVPDERTLREIQTLHELFEYLELSTVALLLQRGTSWGTMASQLGVKRQSLHRRVAWKAQVLADLRGINRPELESEWRNLVQRMNDRVQELTHAGPRGAANRVARGIRRGRESHPE